MTDTTTGTGTDTDTTTGTDTDTATGTDTDTATGTDTAGTDATTDNDATTDTVAVEAELICMKQQVFGEGVVLDGGALAQHFNDGFEADVERWRSLIEQHGEHPVMLQRLAEAEAKLATPLTASSFAFTPDEFGGWLFVMGPAHLLGKRIRMGDIAGPGLQACDASEFPDSGSSEPAGPVRTEPESHRVDTSGLAPAEAHQVLLELSTSLIPGDELTLTCDVSFFPVPEELAHALSPVSVIWDITTEAGDAPTGEARDPEVTHLDTTGLSLDEARDMALASAAELIPGDFLVLVVDQGFFDNLEIHRALFESGLTVHKNAVATDAFGVLGQDFVSGSPTETWTVHR